MEIDISKPFERVRPLAEEVLQGRRLGIEREALRVDRDGVLAQTGHPSSLGSALCHGKITIDYSEAMPELVTAPVASPEAALQELTQLSAFVYRKLDAAHDGEKLWVSSMPCILGDDSMIPIGRFGPSAVGQFKHLYRVGLAHRYGRLMQLISGVHFNYSLPDAFWSALAPDKSVEDARNEGYFSVLRNLQRHGWIVPYLFGASPAACRSMARGRATPLLTEGGQSLVGEYATSLRLGDVGYNNADKRGFNFHANYDDLPQYIRSLAWAVREPREDYGFIGTHGAQGRRQISANQLQIENEYYASVRPKQVVLPGESPLSALKRRGVAYLELRALDIDPMNPVGISLPVMRVMECLVIFAALADSPSICEQERQVIESNWRQVAHFGRKPGLTLQGADGACGLSTWGQALGQGLLKVARWLDESLPDNPYQKAVESYVLAPLADPEATFSGKVLAQMNDQSEGYYHFAMSRASAHAATMMQWPIAPELMEKYEKMALESLDEETKLNAQSRDLEQYIANYMATWDGLEG